MQQFLFIGVVNHNFTSDKKFKFGLHVFFKEIIIYQLAVIVNRWDVNMFKMKGLNVY